MFKLDRNSFSSGKLSDFKIESDKYVDYTKEEKLAVFVYLQSVAYNYPVNNPPKMDKTIFSARKING